MSKIYRKRKLSSYEVIIKQTPFFFMDENGEEHFDSEDEVVQELVRCKDCKYGITYGITDGFVFCSKPYTERGSAMHRPDWFCADGERR